MKLKLTKTQLRTVIREAVNIKLHGSDMAYDYKMWSRQAHKLGKGSTGHVGLQAAWKNPELLDRYTKAMGLTPEEAHDLKVTLGMTEEGITEEKNEYAICTASVGKSAGTTKRSEWSEADEEKYKKCKEEVKNQ
jgi:hypothetical protein